MAVHDVNFTVPERPLGKVDVDFEVYKNGSKLGTLKLSKGGLEWRQGKRKPVKKNWTWLMERFHE